MGLWLCSGSARPQIGRGGVRLSKSAASELHSVVRPGFVKLVRVRGGQYNVRAVRNAGVWPGCRKLVRGMARGASSSSSSTGAAAFEEGTTVETREKSSSVVKAGGRFETRTNLGDGEHGKSLLQALHEVARVVRVGLQKQKTLASRPWFPQKWFGMDKDAWMKSLAYQAAVNSLLQAVIDIAARGDEGDGRAHFFVQRRMMHLASPLEDSIRHELSSRDPAADDWLWSQQQPLAVAKFLRYLEKDGRFAFTVSKNGYSNSSILSEVDLLKLTISCTAALLMLGSAAVSNPIFTTTLSEEIRNLMNKLQEYIRIDKVYLFCSEIGLKQEFLEIFGSRAADEKKWLDDAEEEFWVYLVQHLLRGALVREGVRSSFKSRDAAEVFERDLAIFGFFATLGRSTRAYLAAKGVSDSEESLSSLLRYLEGGSVLFYPQLATVSIYQLFIEVVCEEMEWLRFYPLSLSLLVHETHGGKGKVKAGIGKAEKLLAIAVAVQVCSSWVNNFTQHSTWVQQPEGFRASSFLAKSQQRLEECNEAYELVKRNTKESSVGSIYQDLQWASAEEVSTSGSIWDVKTQDLSVLERAALTITDKLATERRSLKEVEQQLKSIDKELQSVEVALAKLELLVKESEISGFVGGERLNADLDKIRSLKREVEVLEATFKAKAAGKEERIMELQVEQEITTRNLYQQRNLSSEDFATVQDKNSQAQKRRRSDNALISRNDYDEVLYNEQVAETALEEAGAASTNVKTFDELMKELAELESRIQQSADQSASVKSLSQEEWERASAYEVASTTALARTDETLDIELAGEYSGFFSKSIEKLKEASTDIWRGSCLLGTDVGAALVLLRKNILGQKLTNREQKILKRTLTDLASVVPIGILMLLPVTAVGHAAILAAIQKYVPALIPSAYGSQRLDVLRRLEQVRHMEPESSEKPALSSRKLEGSL